MGQCKAAHLQGLDPDEILYCFRHEGHEGQHENAYGGSAHDWIEDYQGTILRHTDAHLRDAVAAERERAARVAEKYSEDWCECGESIAAAIRGLGDEGK